MTKICYCNFYYVILQVFNLATLQNVCKLTKLDMFLKGISPCGAKTLFEDPFHLNQPKNVTK